MKLKGRADGDKGVPETERVFFSVALPLASKLTPKALFFSKVSNACHARQCCDVHGGG